MLLADIKPWGNFLSDMLLVDKMHQGNFLDNIAFYTVLVFSKDDVAFIFISTVHEYVKLCCQDHTPQTPTTPVKKKKKGIMKACHCKIMTEKKLATHHRQKIWRWHQTGSESYPLIWTSEISNIQS
jgi:hypothetical protein